MASELSDYLVNSVILPWVKGIAPPAAPATVYASIHDGDCGVNGTGGTDVTTTVRTAGRVAVPWGAIANRGVANNAVVDFGASVGTADIDSIAFWTAQVGGNCIAASPIATQSVTPGVEVKIPVGTATIAFN